MSTQARVSSKRVISWLLFILSTGLFPFIVMGSSGGVFERLWVRSFLFLAVCGIGAILLKRLLPGKSWLEVSLAALLVNGTVYRLAVYIPDISSYPLALDWSETSRYYYASLFFSRSIYGMAVPLSVMHPTRYVMQAVPFIIPGLPLWFHRFWQVLLWLVFTGGTAMLLSRKLAVLDRTVRFFFILWAALFLLQGPVYYHLLVMVILVLWGFNKSRPWRTLIVVLLASLWAGVSRINWAPMPGLLAAAMFFCEVEVGKKPTWRYLAWPVVWSLFGTIPAFLSQAAYTRWSGNPPEFFGSSFSSDLLWYRLFPSATYPLGVIPAAVLVFLPLLVLIGLRLVEQRRGWHILRLLGLGSILFVLFAGGVVVSAKIGGGSNLHNLDAFLALFCVVASTILLNRCVLDTPDASTSADPLDVASSWRIDNFNRVLLTLAVIVPVGFAISMGGQYNPPGKAKAEAGIAAVRDIVEKTAQNGGEVLFISERHLLTFHTITAPLFPEYEKVFLMEMAMSNNQAYLNTFYNDLHSHRFAIIVVHPQRVNYQGSVHVFGEENDAWVKRVTEPLLCEYKSFLKLPEIRIELFIPREGTRSCP